jgi:hypothetical protein
MYTRALVWLGMVGCVQRLEPPAEGPGNDRLVTGQWTRTSLRSLSGSGVRHAAALALDPDGAPGVLTGEGASPHDAVLWWTLNGFTWREQQLQSDANASILGAEVAAGVLPDHTPCAAWSWQYEASLVLSCGAASATIPNVWMAYDLDLTVAPEGVHLVWLLGNAVYHRAPDGLVQDLPDSAGAGALQAALGPQGQLYVAHLSSSHIHLSELLEDGTWQTAAVYTGPLPIFYDDAVALAVSPGGRVAVAYNEEAESLVLWEDGVITSLESDDNGGMALAYGPGETLHLAYTSDGQLRLGVLHEGELVSEVLSSTASDLPIAGDLELALDAAGRPTVLSHNAQHTPVFQRSEPMVEIEATPAVRALSDLAEGELVITEFLANPASVADEVGEWIEIFNPGTAPVDLDGLILEDEGGHQGIVQGSVVLQPGEHALLGRTAPAQFAPASLAPVAFYGSEPALNNSGDRLRLVGPQGLIDETFRYGSSQAPSGSAWQLSAESLDAASNDDPARWCRASSVYEGGDRGTPGEPNDC